MKKSELKVGSVMTSEVIKARADAPFKEVVQLMHEHSISGLPIVDAVGTLEGIVTEADLLFVEEEQGEPTVRGRTFLTWFIHPAKLEVIEDRSSMVTAADIMTRDVVTVGPETTVRRAIKVLLDAGIKRLPVVDDEGRVVGIVSRRDLLTPFLRADDEIAEEIGLGVIFETMWIDPDTIRVEVLGGVATLTGQVETRSTKEILFELVRKVDGVVGVEDHLSFGWDDRKTRMQEPFGAPRKPENWSPRMGA